MTESHPDRGDRESPKGNPSSSKEKVRKRTKNKAEKNQKPETTGVISLEEEKTGVTAPKRTMADVDPNTARLKAYFEASDKELLAKRPTQEAVDQYMETYVPASAMGSIAAELLTFQKELSWMPWNPKGWKTDMTLEGAVTHVTKNAVEWRKFRKNTAAKLLISGLPPTNSAEDGNTIINEPVFCSLCEKMTTAYGQQKKLTNRREGYTEIDQCDDCLSRQPVGV